MRSDSSPQRKLSEMFAELAADFRGMGNSIGERQNRLNAAWRCRTSGVPQAMFQAV